VIEDSLDDGGAFGREILAARPPVADTRMPWLRQ